MLEKRKKFTPVAKRSTASSVQGAMFGMANYLPSAPESEDDESTQRHVKWLKGAIKSRKSDDGAKVSSLMDLTLYHRRKMSIDGASTAELAEEYPWLLKDTNQVLLEMRRISGLNIEEEMKCFLDKYGNAILRACRDKHMLHSNKNSIINHLAEMKPCKDDEAYVAACIAILGVVLLLKEDPEQMMGLQVPEPAVSPVYIQFDGSPERFSECTDFMLYVDGIPTVTCGDFIEATQVYVCSFYIFNLVQPQTIAKSLLFFDRVILGVKDSKSNVTKKQKDNQKRVVALLSMLNTLRSVGGLKKSSQT